MKRRLAVGLLALIVIPTRVGFAATSVWTRVSPPTVGESALAIDPVNPETLYASLAIGGMAKSTDGGKDWTQLPFSAPLLREIVVPRSAVNHVFAFAWDAPENVSYSSSDGGASWVSHRFRSPVIGSIWDIDVDPLNHNAIYGAVGRSCLSTCIPDSGGVIRSRDGGRTWSTLFKGVGTNQVIVDPLEPGRIYTAGSPAQRSDDNGTTWKSLGLPDGREIFRIALDPVFAGVVYASSTGGFWRSDDRGDHWQMLASWSSAFDPVMWSIAVNANDRNVIIGALSNGRGVARSTDGGRSWSVITSGLNMREAPTQIGWMNTVVFAAGGKAYGSVAGVGVVALELVPTPRRRASRH